MPFGHPNPTSSPRERKTRAVDVRRQKAAVLIALFVAGQAFSGLHLAVEEHATCEHGDVVHASSLGSAQEDALSPNAPPANAPLANAALQPRELPTEIEDEHDHCDVLARHQQGVVSSDRLEVAPGLATDFFAPSTVPAFEIVVAKALYRLAPKQSPPLV